jgi:hypothetical protein
MRMSMRRFTRLTLAFSKKRENFEAAVALGSEAKAKNQSVSEWGRSTIDAALGA